MEIAKLDEETQGFVVGDVMRAIYDLKHGTTEKSENEILSKIIVFSNKIDKYAN